MKSSQKTIAVVDYENLMASAIDRDRKIDWKLLRDELVRGNDVQKDLLEMCVVYGLPPDLKRYRDKRHAIMRRIRECRKHGIFAIPREGVPQGDGYKSNVDVKFTISCLLYALDVHPNSMILTSGDGDYTDLTDVLRQRFGIRVEIASVDESMSESLRLSANDVIDLKRYFDRCPSISKRRNKIALVDKTAATQTKISEIGEICKPALDALNKSNKTA